MNTILSFEFFQSGIGAFSAVRNFELRFFLELSEAEIETKRKQGFKITDAD